MIAAPGFKDDFFEDSLIYVCSHSQDGAFGFVINKAIENISCEDVIKDLVNVDALSFRSTNVYMGGPLDKIRGFVLHTTDYMGKDSVQVDKEIAISSSLSIIADIANDKGPKNNIVVLGHTSWEAGQLENEIKNNYWFVVDCDNELLFETPYEDKRTKAFEKLGLSIDRVSINYGHA